MVRIRWLRWPLKNKMRESMGTLQQKHLEVRLGCTYCFAQHEREVRSEIVSHVVVELIPNNSRACWEHAAVWTETSELDECSICCWLSEIQSLEKGTRVTKGRPLVIQQSYGKWPVCRLSYVHINKWWLSIAMLGYQTVNKHRRVLWCSNGSMLLGGVCESWTILWFQHPNT